MSANGTQDRAIFEIRRDMTRLRGELFELVESWGIDERRENAMKGMVRSLTYRSQTELESIVRRRGT